MTCNRHMIKINRRKLTCMAVHQYAYTLHTARKENSFFWRKFHTNDKRNIIQMEHFSNTESKNIIQKQKKEKEENFLADSFW